MFLMPVSCKSYSAVMSSTQMPRLEAAQDQQLGCLPRAYCLGTGNYWLLLNATH